jgi:hypothetical protein
MLRAKTSTAGASTVPPRGLDDIVVTESLITRLTELGLSEQAIARGPTDHETRSIWYTMKGDQKEDTQ